MPIWSFADAVERLRDPFAIEDLAHPPAPVRPFVVDLRGLRPPVPEADRELLRSSLRALRTVTVGIVGDEVHPGVADIVEPFDLLFAPPGSTGAAATAVVAFDDVDLAIEEVESALERAPHAGVALAQLLRMEAYRDVASGLVAESLAYSTLQSGPEFGHWLATRTRRRIDDNPAPAVLVERRDATLWCTLNRPERRNAFSAAMRDALVDALRLAWADRGLEGVVLRGAGPAFSAGGDLAEFGTHADPATAHAVRTLRSTAWWIHRLEHHTRALIHGHCVGAGIELPSYCGTVIAAEDTLVSLPEVGLGLVPGAGGTVSLPRRIGRHRTCWLALTGARLDARTALAWGLVDRIVSAHPSD
ncbi:MAG: enoyl-CoA hydratase/isomerase family protein [Acidimicrobiales bacterium]|nr:enoyl-CoA hydratase/isomerase family protein [Acidimicrobiales bacterium]